MLAANLPRGHEWTCVRCENHYETPARMVPIDETCSECKHGEARQGCTLAEGVSCIGGWHVELDTEGRKLAVERCQRAVAEEWRRRAEAQRSGGLRGFKEFDRARQPEMFNAAWKWCQECEGRATLALVGPTGTGKSHLLMAARYYLILRHLSVSWITREDLTLAVNAFRSMGAQVDKWLPRWERWCTSDVLIFDDLGHEQSPAEETAGFVNDILDQRGPRPLGFATNLTREQMGGSTGRYGDPMASRLFHGAVVPPVRADDYRSAR